MKTEYLRRYTNLPALLDILLNKRLTLLDPGNWDDRNDSYFIEQYKKKEKLKTVLALCFTGRGERYHHWKVFSDGSSGICITFKKDILRDNLKNKLNTLKYDVVSYKKIKDLRNHKIKVADLPFVKRFPYKDEKEFRVIYESKKEEVSYKHLSISIDSIEKIVINPWIPEFLYPSIKQTIKGVKGCSELKVSKTTLISNDLWKGMGKVIV